MDVIFEKNYLVFPISDNAPEVSIRFLEHGKLLGSYSLPYTEDNPTGSAYLDVRRLRNRRLTLETSTPVYLRQVDQQTVPLLDPSREPASPAMQPQYAPQLGPPIFRADTFYMHYAYTPVSLTWHEIALTPKAPYLVLPVREDAPVRLLRFLDHGTLLAEYRVRLCPEKPEFMAYLDTSRLTGRALTIQSDCEVPIEEAQEIQFQDLYREISRPQIHFTVKNGWNNDPNGLIYLDGIYHMFYQYGPCSVHWNNLHWGHATSKDLIHWQEQPCALCPDQVGTIASGSAVLDQQNVSGLGTKQSPPVLLFYSNTGDGFVQHIAYSTDHLQTIHKMECEPVLPNICAGNRDPSVVWCEELKAWLMALYMDGDEYWLFSSDNLLHWRLHQQLHLPGDNECPDLYPILSDCGERKWVLSGAHDVYVIGSFRDGFFVPEQSPAQLSYGGLMYAAQTFRETWPDVYRISWDMTTNWECRASQQMGIPTKMTLRKEADRYRLCGYPVEAFASLHEQTFSSTAIGLHEGQPYSASLKAAPTDLVLSLDNRLSGNLWIDLFDFPVTLNFDTRTITAGNTAAPLLARANAVRLRLIYDSRTLELYVDEGAAILAAEYAMDFSQCTLRLHSNVSLTVQSLQASALHTIWNAT